jgi:hypothetical protein
MGHGLVLLSKNIWIRKEIEFGSGIFAGIYCSHTRVFKEIKWGQYKLPLQHLIKSIKKRVLFVRILPVSKEKARYPCI